MAGGRRRGRSWYSGRKGSARKLSSLWCPQESKPEQIRLEWALWSPLIPSCPLHSLGAVGTFPDLYPNILPQFSGPLFKVLGAQMSIASITKLHHPEDQLARPSRPASALTSPRTCL